MRFAALYTSWLAAQQLTRTAAAARLGLSVQTSHDYAAGISLPTRPGLGRLATAMGVDLAELSGAVDHDRSLRRAAAVEAAAKAGAPLVPASSLPRPSTEPATTAPQGFGW